MPQEVIEITEREIEIIEVIERGPVGQTGPQPNINYEVVTSSRTVSSRQLIAADTSGGSFTLTLPANPAAGDAVDIFDYSETFDTNPLTIARNGQPIESLNENLTANVEGAYFTLIYTGSTRGWQVVPRFGTSGGGGESALTTEGDMLYRGAGINTRLPIGSAGQILKVNSGATAPEWGAAPATGVTSVSGTAPIVSSGGATPAISINPATQSNAGSMSSADKTKLDGIAAGAEVNVQANWTEANSGSDAFILNKPSTFAPTAHAASHASTGSDPLFDQDLNTSDSPTFAGLTVDEFGSLTVAANGIVDFTAAQNVDFGPINTSIAIKDNSSQNTGTFQVDNDSLTANRTYDLPDRSGELMIVGDAPASHAHGNLTNDGKLGSTAGLPVVTTTAGAVTTLALGTANQVLKVNSGATGVEFGTVDSVDDYTVITTGQTATNGARIAADTTASAFTLTLPATPSNGDTIYILDYAGTFDTNNLTLGRNGSNIEGLSEDMTCNVEGSSFKMVYTGATNGWQMIPYYGTGVNVGGSAADVLSVSSGELVADDAGADRIIFWDDSESKLRYLEAGSGLSISGTTLSATASGGSKTYAVFTATDNQPPATNFMTLDTRNGIAVLDADDATDESAVFVSIIPEGASLGSGLKIRLHWMATTATSGNVVWDVSLERMTTDLDSDSFDTIASGTAAANGTSGILTVTEITLTTIDSVTAGDGFRLKVTRDANNASDTMTGDAELVVCEVRSAA